MNSEKRNSHSRRWVAIATSTILFALNTYAVPPVVSNIRGSQRPGTKLVEIRYDVSDTDSSFLAISVGVSTNGDNISDFTACAFETGSAVGICISPGRDKLIVWNAGVDWNGNYSQLVKFQITANDAATSPADMVPIPVGSFTMGDSFGDGGELQHTVYVSAFYMDKYEVTKTKWDEVYTWAVTNGYSFGATGQVKTVNHPVHWVSWYDCVKWCNARSEKEGRTPSYYTSASLIPANIYRSGQVNVSNTWVRWDVGYRLPTEAEWEKAARGGVANHRFPWSDVDTIQHARANYCAAAVASYDTESDGAHPTYNDGVYPYTSPVGAFETGKNGYGLYDMAGNLFEWCWDWMSTSYYSSSPKINPLGPDTGSARVRRGGSWCYMAGYADLCRVASRTSSMPITTQFYLGFRVVLPPGL